MVLHKDSMAHHDIAKSCNGQRHQSVPGSEKHRNKGVEAAEDGRVQDAPGRLIERGVDAEDNIGSTVADDQEVKSRPFLSVDADPGPQVDCKSEHSDRDVCNQESHILGFIHLEYSNYTARFSSRDMSGFWCL